MIDVAISGPVSGGVRDSAIEFLRAEGYTPPIDSAHQIFAAHFDSDVVGAVRLAVEHNTLVLRGMRVRSDVRRRGIGRLLLQNVADSLCKRICYCIPYTWLVDFYGQIGFKPMKLDQAPDFLAERHARYVEQGLDVVIMIRDQGESG